MFSEFENKDTKERLIVVGKIEGWSFLILIFIAMPLKYLFDIPIATKIIGMIHGGLFVWFLVMLYDFHMEYNKGLKLTIIGFISSLIPFGTFFFNKRLMGVEN
jgi:integral membrane protein